jgi:hypothetical protein
MSIHRRIGKLEKQLDPDRPTPAIIEMDGTITHRGREITAEELAALPRDPRTGIRAVDFRSRSRKPSP